jgi:hypothetical protein
MQSITKFPDGTSLTLELKDDIDPSQIITDYNLRVNEIQDKDKAIEKLSKKRVDAGTPHEAKKITAQIKEWESVGSYFSLADETILAVANDWDLVDAQTKEPKPFNAQSLKFVHLTRKTKVIEQLIKDLGFDERELTDPKQSLSESAKPLLSESTAASNSPNGQ